MSFVLDANQRRLPPGQHRYIFYKQVNGKRPKERVVCRKSEVHRVYAEWEEALIARSGGEVTSLFALFHRYLNEFSRIRKTDKQYRAETTFFEKRFTKFFENMQLKEFRRCHVERYLAWRYDNQARGGPSSRSTVNKDLNMISSFISWAIRNDLYDRANPCRGLRVNEQNERHIRLTGEELVELFTNAALHPGLFTVVMIGIFAGMRKSEMSSLQWTDIDFANQRIEVRAETAKGHKHRSIPMPDVLRDYLSGLPRKSDKVTISEATLKRHFKDLQNRLSFLDHVPKNRLTVHDLRHIYAQTQRDAATSIDDIQHFMGHSSPTVTHKRYAQAGGYDGVTKVNMIAKIIDIDRVRALTQEIGGVPRCSKIGMEKP